MTKTQARAMADNYPAMINVYSVAYEPTYSSVIGKMDKSLLLELIKNPTVKVLAPRMEPATDLTWDFELQKGKIENDDVMFWNINLQPKHGHKKKWKDFFGKQLQR